MEPSTVSVVVCTYDPARWEELCAAIGSLHKQTRRPEEVVVVVDHNDALYQRAKAELTGVVVVENRSSRGVAGARNTGLVQSCSNIVAFLDDDAEAVPSWLQVIFAGHADPSVLGVGGEVLPVWSGRPGWLPHEFDWVVGCSYKGLPTESGPVRNLFGGNMSVVRQVALDLGGFGRRGLPADGGDGVTPGKADYGAEETEFCIRGSAAMPGRHWLYDPAARILHQVPPRRTSARYFVQRCFLEGRVKRRVVVEHVGSRSGLSAERTFIRGLVTGGGRKALAGGVHVGDPRRYLPLVAMFVGVAAAAAGFTVESVKMVVRPTRDDFADRHDGIDQESSSA